MRSKDQVPDGHSRREGGREGWREGRRKVGREVRKIVCENADIR